MDLKKKSQKSMASTTAFSTKSVGNKNDKTIPDSLIGLMELQRQMEYHDELSREIGSARVGYDMLSILFAVVSYVGLFFLIKLSLNLFEISAFYTYVISLAVPMIIYFVALKRLIRALVTRMIPTEKKELLREYRQKWATVSRLIYNNDLVPHEYIDHDYIGFLINEFESGKASDLDSAMERLEEYIIDIEDREIKNGMTLSDNGIRKEIDKIYKRAQDLASVHQKEEAEQIKLEKRYPYIPYKPSKLVDQTYIRKFVEEQRRLAEERRRREAEKRQKNLERIQREEIRRHLQNERDK